MKLRLFHRNKPAGIQVPAVCDTLSRVSVACIELTPEGELTDINMQAYKVLRLGGGGDFSHPLRISDLFSVCQYQKDLLPAIFKGLERHKTYGDLPPWSYIQLSGRDNLKFYIEGRFVGHYDRHRKLRRIVFLFRDIEEEVCRRFILDMAMAQTKIFPWFFDLDNGRMVIDARWFDHVGIPRGDCSMSPGIFFDMLHPDDRETLSAAFAKQLSGILPPRHTPTASAAATGHGNGSRDNPYTWGRHTTARPIAWWVSARASSPTRRSKDICAKPATRPAKTTGSNRRSWPT